MKCVVVGAGAWGTTIAQVLAQKNNSTVVLWTHEPEVVASCKQYQENKKYLPGYTLHPSLMVTCDLQKALEDATYIFLAIPVAHCAAVLQKAACFTTPQQSWIVLSKGVDSTSMQLPSDLIKKYCQSDTIALLMGPSFAVDVMQKKLTACVVATRDENLFKEIEKLIITDYFQVMHTVDEVGVAWCAALKNLIALSRAIALGLGYTENTCAYLLTVALQELAAVVVATGGSLHTVLGLAGVGDSVMTAYSEKSKNVRAGMLLAQGMTVQEYQKQYVTVPESFNTVLVIEKLQKKYNLHLPLYMFLADLVQGKARVQDLIKVFS